MAGRGHFKLAPLIAHRGVPLLAPENSLAGFALAAEIGYDWVELDTQAASDEVAMVHHDAKLSVLSRIAYMSSAELGRHEIGSYRGEAELMPTLASCLKLLSERELGVVIEVKSTPTRERVDAGAVLAALADIGPARLMVASFFPKVLEIFAAARPDLPLALNTRAPPPRVAAHVNNVHFRQEDAASAPIAALRAQGVGVYSYTVNTAKRAAELYAMGVAGVFTDNHRLLEISG